jgi:hypothetical protein
MKLALFTNENMFKWLIELCDMVGEDLEEEKEKLMKELKKIQAMRITEA